MHSIYTTVNLNNKKEFILHNKLTWISSLTSICQCLFDWHCYLLCFLLDQWGKWLLPLRDVLLAGYYGITADNGICLLLDTLLEEKVAVLLRENGRQKRLQSEKKMEAFKIIHLSESMQRSHKLSSQRSYRVVKIHADYCNSLNILQQLFLKPKPKRQNNWYVVLHICLFFFFIWSVPSTINRWSQQDYLSREIWANWLNLILTFSSWPIFIPALTLIFLRNMHKVCSQFISIEKVLSLC